MARPPSASWATTTTSWYVRRAGGGSCAAKPRPTSGEVSGGIQTGPAILSPVRDGCRSQVVLAPWQVTFARPLAAGALASRATGAIARNHDDVTLWWSRPPRCDIVVVR